MKLKFFLFNTISIAILYSCTVIDINDQFSCFQKELFKVKQTPEYKNVMQCFKDTLNNWLVKDIKGVRHLKIWKWEISDAILFNKDYSKCLMLYSEIDPDPYGVFDNVQIVGGEKINNEWHFYIQSFPNSGFNRNELHPKRPYKSKDMIDYSIKSLIDDGYFFKGKCSINYNYIDSENWFADWIRQKHIEFLNNKW